ncbi:unnamed protein product, partial [Owenia fusiformis]
LFIPTICNMMRFAVIVACVAVASALKWEDCGSADKAISVSKVEVTPSPVVIPGNLRLSLEGEIKRQLGDKQLDADLIIRKSLFGIMVDIPCVDGIGSCSYQDVCSLVNDLVTAEGAECPAEVTQFLGGCSCPFKARQISVPGIDIELPALDGILGGLIAGDIEVEARMKEADGGEVGCLKASFSIDA